MTWTFSEKAKGSRSAMGIDLKLFEENIKKTGFTLEYKASEIFRRHGWTLINNKFYIDDVQGSVREVDMVAYKTTKFEDIFAYTVIIVSCKKDDQNTWVLLAKERNAVDPNVNWYPLHVWTNDRVVNCMLTTSPWEKEYVQNAMTSKFSAILEPGYHVFAFQEMNKINGRPQNDKAIFSSISSLMKAQGYEIDSLGRRKTTKCCYTFNLIAVVDTELVRLLFNRDGVKGDEIQDDLYIGSYIINQKEVNARIHLCKIGKLDNLLKSYDLLHKFNVDFFKKLYQAYFETPFADRDRTDLFEKDFTKKVVHHLNYLLRQSGSKHQETGDLYLFWDTSEASLRIMFSGDEEEARVLNTNKQLSTLTAEALKLLYRYDGKFHYTAIPF